MPADTILVIDAGTTALRSLSVGDDGDVRTIGSRPWPIFIPDDAAPFGREFVASEVVDALAALVGSVAEHGRIAAIACTSQREGLVFLDDAGTALLVSPNIDARASAEGMAIDATRGDDVYATTGHLPSLMQASAKLAWLRRHRPEIAARVAHVLPLADWLAMLLSGTMRMSRTLAAENGLLDITTGALASELLASLDLPVKLVPTIAVDGAIVGDVRKGTLAGVPVVLAGGDTQCALVGLGAIESGDAGVPAGWSAPLQLVTPAPVIDCEQRTWTSVHAVPGRWILESNAGETGRAWDWICSMMRLSNEEADAHAAESPAGSHDVMSILGARTMRASRMNAGAGAITLPLPLVMSSPERGDVLRSVLESAAFAIRANLEQLEQVSGRAIPRLRLGGGMSRSRLFAQIVADDIDRPVDVARACETSAVGAAALAAVAVGLHASITEACEAMAHTTELTPDVRASVVYEDCYARWCGLADGFERMTTEGG